MATFVKFWGTRGSIPVPGRSSRVYGGNTACVEIRIDETQFICDAGSGMRELGMDMMKRGECEGEIHLLITHTHWDHIQGFPFFAPAYLPNARIRVYEPGGADSQSFRLLSGQMTSPYFPVAFGDLRATIIQDELGDEEKLIDGVVLRAFPLNHPGGAYGYSLEKDGCKIVYATDNELVLPEGSPFPDNDPKSPLRPAPIDLLHACEGAQLLIMDAQFSDEQYQDRVGWGHSSSRSVVDLAVEAKVEQLALFHHDPSNANAKIDEIVQACRDRIEGLGSKVVVFGAREGVELKYDHPNAKSE